MRRAGVQGGRRGAWRGRAAVAAAACALTNCQLVGGFEELPLACPEGTTLNGAGDQATCEPPAGAAGEAGRAGTGGGGGGGRAGATYMPPPRPGRARIGLGDYAQRLREDAASVPSADRARLVYVDLHALYNREQFADADLARFADAVLVLLNHLDVTSTAAGHEGAAVVRDGTSMLPLAVRFDAARFNLDRQRDVVSTLVRLSNRADVDAPFACDVPVIPVLDFMYVASSDSVYNPFGDGGRGTYESGYSNIVVRRLLEAAGVLGPGQLVFEPAPEQAYSAAGSVNVSASASVFDLLAALDPATLGRPGLEAIYDQGNQEGRLLRGCVLSSNVSGSNRCIDRLEQGDEGGAIYLSLDVAPENVGAPNKNFLEARFVGPANPPGDPLVAPQGGVTPFEIDRGEGFFRLKNSMFGFFAFDGDFRLLSESPTYRGGVNPGVAPGGVSGVGCTYCHSRFSLLFEDVLWPTVSGASGDEFAFAAKIAQDAGEWQVTFDLDWEPYGKALRNASVLEEGEEEASLAAVGSLGTMYEYDLSSEDVAVELGLKGAADLAGRVKDLPFLQNALAANGGVSRKTFTLYYQTLVDQADPADQDFLRGCLARQAGDLDP